MSNPDLIFFTQHIARIFKGLHRELFPWYYIQHKKTFDNIIKSLEESKYFVGSLLDLALKQPIARPQGHLGSYGHPGDVAESKLADFPISPTMVSGLGVETRILAAAGFSAISHFPPSQILHHLPMHWIHIFLTKVKNDNIKGISDPSNRNVSEILLL